MDLEFEAYVDEAQLIRHCAPVFFLPSPDPTPAGITTNGTVGLIDTGDKELLVTCQHVWAGFQKFKTEHLTARLATVFANGFGHPVTIPESALIDADAALDLATFEATPEQWDMGSKEFFKTIRWPIPRARRGNPLIFLGFAGEGRRTSSTFGLFSYSSFTLSVADSSDRKIVVAKGGGRHELIGRDGKPMPPMAMGGLSGSPAYVLKGLGCFELAGFVQMGETSADDIFLTHASFLNRDGTIQRY